MSKQHDNGVWEHRMWCNYWSRPGPCRCCENHPEWPYVSDLSKKYPGLSEEELFLKEQQEKWPDAQIRK